MNTRHHDERADNGNHGEEEVFRTVVGKFGNVHQVADNTGHDGTGLVVVEIGQGKTFEVVKNLAAHIRLHIHTDKMSDVGYEIVEQELRNIDEQENHRPDHEKIDLVVRDVDVQHIAGDVRVDEVAQGKHERAYHVRDEHFDMRPVVPGEPFENLHDNVLSYA